MKNTFIRRIPAFLISPIVEEFPFFFVFVLLFEANLIGVPISLYFNYDPIWATGFLKLLGTLFVYAYLLTFIVYYAKSRTLKYFLLFVLFFLYGMNSFLQLNFGYKISPNVLLLIVETNGREAMEFAHLFGLAKGSLMTYGKIAVCLAIALGAAFLYNYYVLKKIKNRQKIYSILFLPVIFMLGWGFSTFGPVIRICRHVTIDDFFQRQTMELYIPQDPITETCLSLRGLYLLSSENRSAVDVTKKVLEESRPSFLPDASDSLNVILVIGESFNKWHSELYGYPHHTTPNLRREAERGNLFVFNDVISPFCLTSASVKNLLSCNSISDGESWSQFPYFPTIFKMAGYNVYFWDNQKNYMSGAFPVTFSLDSYLYDKEISQITYTATNDSAYAYDDELVSSFILSEPRLSDHNFIMFHLLGQHFDFKERYPQTEEFQYFTADSVQRQESYMQDADRKQCVAEYDNAIRYNDYVLEHIIDTYRRGNTIIVFLSDHGEEAYDYKENGVHRHYEGSMTMGWLKNVHNIPFFIWCSNRYRQSHPETIEAIRRSTSRPFMTDNLCHLMFTLGEICPPQYLPEHDLISYRFKPRKRFIEDMLTNRKYDYDVLWNAQNRE